MEIDLCYVGVKAVAYISEMTYLSVCNLNNAPNFGSYVTGNVASPVQRTTGKYSIGLVSFFILKIKGNITFSVSKIKKCRHYL